MNKELWEKCVTFHGHQCPGLAIGYRASVVAYEKLGYEPSPDEDVVCISENDACGVDAVQLITGCTVGKGNLIFRNRGKMAFSFYDRRTGKNIRLMLKTIGEEMSREEKQNFILNKPVEEVFDIMEPYYPLPEKARIFNSETCEVCGEKTAEHMIRLTQGKKVCLDCSEGYTRGW